MDGRPVHPSDDALVEGQRPVGVRVTRTDHHVGPRQQLVQRDATVEHDARLPDGEVLPQVSLALALTTQPRSRVRLGAHHFGAGPREQPAAIGPRQIGVDLDDSNVPHLSLRAVRHRRRADLDGWEKLSRATDLEQPDPAERDPA